MIVIPTPSRYYEVEFFADGHIEGQVFGPATQVETVTVDEIADTIYRNAVD